MGLRVLTPDVNTSQMDFSVHDGAIRFGLSAIRNVGEGVVQRILEERAADGPFSHFQEFIDRGPPGAQQAHHRVADQGGCLRRDGPF